MHVLHIYKNFFFTYIHVDLHMYIYIYIIYTIIYMFDFYLYISFCICIYICNIYMYIHVQIPMIYTYIYVYMGTLTQSFGYCTVPNVYGLFFGANPRSFMRFFGRRRYPRNGPLLGVSLSQKCLFLTSCNDSNSLSSSINLRSKQYQ